jgi:hypothetical protein
MLKRFMPGNLLVWARWNILGAATLILGSLAFVAASFVVLRAYDSNFERLSSSSWVSPPRDEEKQPYKSGQRYDLSNQGIDIPPSREDRTAEADSQKAAQGAEHHRRTCYEQAQTQAESDLCAQWSNAAAVRFGNRIALESFRLNSWIGFLSALGVFLAAIGVVFAGMASLQASRGITMMAYGFMPVLSISVTKSKSGWVKITVRNAGTGPATEIRVSVDGQRVTMKQDRLGTGAHATVDHRATGDDLKISAECLDLAQKRCAFSKRFVRNGSEWVLNEEQTEDT